MKEIKLTIQKNEDIVLLTQGLNWIRQHNLNELSKETPLIEMDKRFNLIEERAETHDRLISIIVQLDTILEDLK
jgi:hypothetical protein